MKNDDVNVKNADKCYICNKNTPKKDIRVRDHCHIIRKYRGSTHQDCYINYRLTDKILVIFHNLREYDSHFIMQMIGEIANKHTCKNRKGEDKRMDINVIPNIYGKIHGFHAWKTFGFWFLSTAFSS